MMRSVIVIINKRIYNDERRVEHILLGGDNNKPCRRPPQYAPPPCKLTFDHLALKVLSESTAV